MEDSSKEAVLALFPDICPIYLERISGEHEHDPENIAAHILDQSESGNPYPKRPRASLKRKRPELEDEDNVKENGKRFDNPERRLQLKSAAYLKLSRSLVMQEFPRVFAKDVGQILARNDNCLFPAMLALHERVSSENNDRLPLKSQMTKQNPLWEDDQMRQTMENTTDEAEKSAYEEFQAARAVIRARFLKQDAERQREQEELENLELAKAEGNMVDCGCCYEEFPLNRMVHCNGEPLHWFCRDCARRMAETVIGLSKYELSCMSMDSCTAGFSRTQRDLFLDPKSVIALDRIEQEAILRLAGIEDLETCPFCPFAAEYPPATENKEFTCQNPECELVSCRLCRQETHIPKTCQEALRDSGHSARRVIEEAMSAAIIRNCNKCGTPFIKERGCNKMTCTRNGCMNIQCYVCHKSCDYQHFDDTRRGGRKGNCPLFDSFEQRHEEEVRAAEELARKKAREENPDVSDDMFEIKVSDKVKEDDERRKREAGPSGMPMAGPIWDGGAPPLVNPDRHRAAVYDGVARLHGIVRRRVEDALHHQVHKIVRADMPGIIQPALPDGADQGRPNNGVEPQQQPVVPGLAAAETARPGMTATLDLMKSALADLRNPNAGHQRARVFLDAMRHAHFEQGSSIVQRQRQIAARRTQGIGLVEQGSEARRVQNQQGAVPAAKGGLNQSGTDQENTPAANNGMAEQGRQLQPIMDGLASPKPATSRTVAQPFNPQGHERARRAMAIEIGAKSDSQSQAQNGREEIVAVRKEACNNLQRQPVPLPDQARTQRLQDHVKLLAENLNKGSREQQQLKRAQEAQLAAQLLNQARMAHILHKQQQQIQQQLLDEQRALACEEGNLPREGVAHLRERLQAQQQQLHDLQAQAAVHQQLLESAFNHQRQAQEKIAASEGREVDGGGAAAAEARAPPVVIDLIDSPPRQRTRAFQPYRTPVPVVPLMPIGRDQLEGQAAGPLGAGGADLV